MSEPYTFTLPADTPKAWRDLVEAVTILARHQDNAVSPFHCEHDLLTVCSDPNKYTPEEIDHLEELGFHVGNDYDDECFSSYRFGSA